MDPSIEAVRRAIGRALQPISDGALEVWASGCELGINVRALRMELQCAQWMLNNTRGNRHSHGREIQDRALAKLLQELLGLSYRADDALDELDYFRIQDELDGSYHAADEDGSASRGCLRNLILNARHTVCAIHGAAGKNLPRFSGSPVQNDANSVIASNGSRLFCCTRSKKVSRREVLLQTPKLRFNRVEKSQEMKEIVEQLKHVCAKVSTILNNLEFLDSNCSVAQCIATRLNTNDSRNRWQKPMHRDGMSRPSKPIDTRIYGMVAEPKFYGRMELESMIIHDITMGECCDKYLTVLPIVGPGGIGKTTLAQHIFQELQAHFEVTLWVNVSINFNVYRLTKDIAYTLTDDIRDSPDKLVEERLKSKRFLLVLDDLWSCDDDEWKRFLVPFMRGETTGSVILVTTRFPKIALMVKTTKSMIELTGLEHEAFRELFMSQAFGDDMQAQNDSGLIAIGDRILQKLKGSPLAAKIVGRLLRNNLTLDHWTRVLESKDWELQSHDYDIMAALKLSFDHLPSHLQQCLTYCALFPEDYKFRTEEIIHFWIGLDILHPRGVDERIEDIGLSFLKDLVVHGFFRKEEENGHTCYGIHDLVHDLALKVSAHDCLIYNSGVRYLEVPPSIRHMAINIDDSSVKDTMTFANCKEDLSALFKRVKVENLHTLMLFGKHQGSFVKIFGDLLFNKARALRVIFISGEACSMEDYLLSNIGKFVHLRYLRIGCASLRSQLSSISRLYHLRVLDLQGCYKMCCGLPRHMGNLIKLRHLLIPDNESHSSIFAVGRLKELQELRRFEAKKESQGFELRQIGHLQELRGSLRIENLERVEVSEANEAKLMLKNHLRRLTLDWNIYRRPLDPACEEQVLEGLKPGSNLLELCISGHGGATCPSWLGVNLSVKNLECLRLDSVAWKIYPAIGELWLVNDHGEKHLSDTSNQGFQNLKRIELVNLVGLKKWVVDHQLFFHLEVLIIKDCPELVELSSPCSTCIGHEKQTWFPRLQELMIDSCPKLLSLPPVPWTCAPLSVRITGVDLCFERLVYKNDNGCASSLEIEGKDSLNSASWMALDFHNLNKLEKLKMVRCPPMPLHLFRMLFSLKTLEISFSNIIFCPVEDASPIQYLFPVESMRICGLGASGKELTQVLSCMPKLSKLSMADCERITGLGIMEQRQKAIPSSNEVETQIGWLQYSTEEEEIAAEGLLLLPPQLQELLVAGCPNLIILLPDSLVDDKESRLTQRAGCCLQGLLSLLSLEIWDCPNFLSYLSLPPCFPFPNSLQKLSLGHVEGMETAVPFCNLTTLTELAITDCGDLRSDGLWHLLTQGSLTKLSVSKTPNFFGSVPLQLHEEGLYFSSSRLQMLWTDDAGVLAAPFCSLLSSSLISLFLFENKEMEYFTKGQEESLMLLTSLEEFGLYYCDRLQCLPAVLHRLPNLKRLEIASSPAIQTLPKEGLPSSLEELKIKCCPAIRTLPKVGLPYSLRVLNVHDSNNEELRMQCRKLIGIIPIVEA